MPGLLKDAARDQGCLATTDKLRHYNASHNQCERHHGAAEMWQYQNLLKKELEKTVTQFSHLILEFSGMSVIVEPGATVTGNLSGETVCILPRALKFEKMRSMVECPNAGRCLRAGDVLSL